MSLQKGVALMDFLNPFRRDEPESPGEQSRRLTSWAEELAFVLGLHLSQRSKDALPTLIDEVEAWWRVIGRSKIRRLVSLFESAMK